MWSPKGTTLRVIRCPTLQVSQYLFPGQRSDTFLTDHVYEGHIFPRPFLQRCRLKWTSLCSNTWIRVNKKLLILIIFIEINENVCLLCAHHVITSTILHTRRPNCQLKVCYALCFYVSAHFFRILKS